MPTRTPPSLDKLCRQTLPLLLRQTSGREMLRAAAEVVATDRWNSFDRFHDTTQTLLRRYQQAGAGAEVETIQTGGRIGSGRWIIHEAADVRAARIDIVGPVRQRLLDWRENPWQVIQWSAATPREGMRCKLVVLDAKEEIERLEPDGLAGKMVLTREDPRPLLKTLADKGAAGVITDRPVPRLPQATAWTKFGWGAIPMERATARLVGFVLSESEGKKLRRLVEKRGELKLQVQADVRKYVGSHDVVCGLVQGADDPQDEVWAIAHSAEPGAVDNASGVALTLEIARVLEGLIRAGKLKRPRRTIRLLNAYECYGFFAYLERVRRLQPPLAGVCLDTVGSKPQVCDGRLEWHATIPMSAGFADRVGEIILRRGIRRHQPGYRLFLEPFVSTADTLIGDPQYGFPCPWLTTHHQKDGRGFDAYHSSADTLELLSPRGLETCAASMAAYLYFLADMGNKELLEVARLETDHFLELLKGKKRPGAEVEYARDLHHLSLKRLERYLWGGDRTQVLAGLAECERQVRQAGERARRPQKRQPVPPQGRKVPRRTAVLSPTTENVPEPIAQKINAARLPSWALFWADGKRNLAQIAARVACEETASVGGGRQRRKREVSLDTIAQFFEAHAELGYVELMDPKDMVTKARLKRDLRSLGLRPGMDLMVHSSLSAIGRVEGGADTVVDALLEAIGRRGTLLMPSFNHRAARVYNPHATPTTNGAIPEALRRRPEAARSLHPSHAVAAIGPRAAQYCRGHLEAGIWGQDSPIGKLVHGGGYILALGTTHWTTTAYHVAEISMPCGCIDQFVNRDRVVDEDGLVKEVPGFAFRSAECPVSPRKLDQALDQRGLQRRGKVGNAQAELVKAIDLWRMRREHLKNACPTCTIKPRVQR